jgi:hypothetical protein
VPTISLHIPTQHEEELLRRFTVNRNYLQALAAFTRYRYGGGTDLYPALQAEVSGHRPYQRIKRLPAVPPDVRRFLILGWTSEIMLHLPAFMSNTAVLGYSNAWAPVHAYYAVYGPLQAWFSANGMSGVADNHTASLRTVGNMIEQRNLFPEPWNLLATGCPMRGDKLHLNVPAGVDCTSHIEVLSTPVPLGPDPDFWKRFGLWLRTTREARLLARERQWKGDNSMDRIPPKERTRIAASLPHVALRLLLADAYQVELRVHRPVPGGPDFRRRSPDFQPRFVHRRQRHRGPARALHRGAYRQSGVRLHRQGLHQHRQQRHLGRHPADPPQQLRVLECRTQTACSRLWVPPIERRECSTQRIDHARPC